MNLSISIVIPMYNAEKNIRCVLEAIYQQEYAGLIEVIVVDDGSTDGSLEIVKQFEDRKNLKIIRQSNQGAVAATNHGFGLAQYDIVCSIDSDVVVHKNWLKKIVEEFDDSRVGAVQGYYKTPGNLSFLARAAGYDMERRYDDMTGKYTTQVNTGNTAYRKSALDKVRLFDPRFKYAYDNDMSYRLGKAGYLLVLKKTAICDHYWKESIKDYVRQQYWSAYGRMQVISKHKAKIFGDTVSGLRMILQVPLTLLIIFLLLLGTSILFFRGPVSVLLTGIVLLLGIYIDRLFFFLDVIRKQNDFSAVLMPFVHLMRNVVWCFAFLKWGIGRMFKINSRGDSGVNEY